jgi:hypothetical protein
MSMLVIVPGEPVNDPRLSRSQHVSCFAFSPAISDYQSVFAGPNANLELSFYVRHDADCGFSAI